MDNKHLVAVAIDGPGGAGKSTIARSVAKELGFIYVDTGAMYRTVGCYVRRRGVEPSDVPGVEALLPEIGIEMSYDENGEQRMYLNGEDVSSEIRLPEISMYASAVSALPAVRAFLLDRQRELARSSNVIMDGRDIGTVVLPDARVKIFLTASEEERARRRYDELKGKGIEQSFDSILEDIRRRDYNDSHRAAAPLRPAEDAVLLDTTGNTFCQSRELILNLIRERLDG